MPPGLWAAWTAAYAQGQGDPVRVGQGFGRIARGWRPQTSPETRRVAVRQRLVTQDFPERLVVAVQDADSGHVVALGRRDGFALADVVSASGAVPGLSPAVQLGEMLGVDGGNGLVHQCLAGART